MRSLHLLAVLVLFGLGPAYVAQPVQAPTLTLPQFRSQDLDPAFLQGQDARSLGQWEYIVAGSLAGLRLDWEQQAEAAILAEVNLLFQSDAFNSEADYQDYLQSALLPQAYTEQLAWEAAAAQAIDAQRALAVARLGGGVLPDDVSINPALQDLLNQHAQWAEQYDEAYDRGMHQFQLSLTALEDEYQEVLLTISESEQEYQTNLAQIDAATERVRQGISNQVDGLRNYLDNSGLFNENGAYNAAGLALDALLTDLAQKLASGAPLSQLVGDMTTYLDTQHRLAVAKRTELAALVRVDHNAVTLWRVSGAERS